MDVVLPYLCLMNGMLMQLAAATAANGTNRLTIGGRRCRHERPSGVKPASTTSVCSTEPSDLLRPET